ncbi:MAG: CapA family protein, partial [Actinobacteria bacterium]|nr:CapA family protein [Actinomycetota bacterium]
MIRRLAPLLALVVLAGCTSSSAPSRPSGSSTPATPATSTGSARSTPRPAPSSSSAPATPRTATVLGSGDVLIHPQLWEQAQADARAEGRSGYDFGPMYASIAPDVRSADLAICEMETPLAPPQGPFVGWPDFNAPPQVLTALKGVGYKSCTTASNHTLDQGYTGLKRTLDELDAAGLKHTGSARSPREATTPLIITLPNGVRIGQLAYSFNFNGHEPPAGQAWEANLTDVPTILAAARRMKQAGADIVVLSMHWGTEYDHLATQLQKDEAAALLASPDIDLILGDHAHVIQPAQKIDGK